MLDPDRGCGHARGLVVRDGGLHVLLGRLQRLERRPKLVRDLRRAPPDQCRLFVRPERRNLEGHLVLKHLVSLLAEDND